MEEYRGRVGDGAKRRRRRGGEKKDCHGERLSYECTAREIAAGGGLSKMMEGRISMSRGKEECRTRFKVLRDN